MSEVDRDTIAAIATATGPGAVTLLRVSGPEAFAILARLCPGLDPALEPRRLSLQAVVDPESREQLDHALVVRFAGPASFTGEDVVEIQGHGGALMADALLGAALRSGARAARAGEFSRRAYQNGRLDLAQAEGLAELIAAGSTAGLRAARSLFGGELSREVQDLLGALARVQAPVEAQIDFPDQSGELDEAGLREGLEALRARLRRLRSSYGQGRRIREGARVLLLGAPNVGKSSLFNALAGHARAIVHEAPGTTRDAVEVALELAGLRLTLIDSAGMRQAPEAVEAEGVERSRQAARAADLILWVSDLDPAGAPPDPAVGELLQSLEGEVPVLRVGNKADLGPGAQRALGLRVSARTGEGMERLEAAIQAALGASRAGEGGEAQVTLTLARHEAAVRAALEALESAAEIFGGGGGLDALAEELTEARRQLAGILGRIALPEELLDQIFGDFCLGK